MSSVLELPPATVVFDADIILVAAARRHVRERLADSVPYTVSSDLQLMVSELFTNAIEHGNADTVLVGVEVSATSASVTVGCLSPAPQVGPVDSWRVADEPQITGRGLGIIRQIADTVHVQRTSGRFVVTVTRTFEPVGACCSVAATAGDELAR